MIASRRPATPSRSGACASRSSCNAFSASAALRSDSVTASPERLNSASSFASTPPSPGCTSPPPRSDLVARILHPQRVEHAPLLSQELRLLFRRRQRDQAVQLGDLPLQAPRLDPVHRPLEQLVRRPAGQP